MNNKLTEQQDLAVRAFLAFLSERGFNISIRLYLEFIGDFREEKK